MTGSRGDRIAIAALDTQTGRVSCAVSSIGLLAVRWSGEDELAGWLARPERAALLGTDAAEPAPDAQPVVDQLSAYFGGRATAFDLPLDWRLVRSPTARAVLGTLHRTVPFGEVVTYGELAARSGTGVPARGVGAVMGGNPIPIVVPCHRVVAAGGLGGFSGGDRHAEATDSTAAGSSPYGLHTKHWMLTFEGALPPMLGWDPQARLDLDEISPVSDGPRRAAAAG